MHKKINILHVIDTTGPGGAETVFVTMCVATKNQGYPTRALLRGKGWLSQQLENAGIDVDYYECKGSFNVSYLRFLRGYIRKHSIDTIHAHLLGSSVYCSLAAMLTKVTVVSTFHGLVDVSEKERALWAKMKLIEFGSTHIVAVSNNLLEMLQQRLGVTGNKKLSLISNGIDTDKFSAQQHSEQYPDTIRFGCLGNVRKAKNYSLAVEFIKQLQDSGINCHLSIAGDNTNTLASDLSAYIKQLNITRHIDLKGFISDTPEYLSEIDVFLLSSSSEGHPLALNQALAMELPVLTTPCGVEQFFPDNLLTVSEDFTAEELKKAFITMGIKSGDKRTVNTEGRKQVLQYYSETVMIQSYLNFYGAA
jgi:glycosyltransferase involved in cell wall biosynthesis